MGFPPTPAVRPARCLSIALVISLGAASSPAQNWLGTAESWGHPRAMTYAANSGRCVQFVECLDRTAYTAAFDGSGWRVFLGPEVTNVYTDVMAHDTARNRTMRWDGMATYELVDDRWQQLSPPTNLPGRDVTAMAFDPVRARMIVFGGQDLSTSLVLADTWEWNGTTWTQITTSTTPPPRMGAAMTFDPIRNRVMLFGGMDNAHNRMGDFWEYDGTNWVQVATGPSAPPARSDAGLTFDTARNVMVMFGGTGSAGVLNDTWQWNGNAWARVLPTTVPIQDYRPKMAFDAARNRTVLCSNGATWLFDGTNWSLATLTQPTDVAGAAMAYDRARGRTVLFGGTRQGQVFNQHWERNSAGNWTQINLPLAPAARSEHTMVYDVARRRCLLFGGVDAGGNLLGDTWVYNGVAWVQLGGPAPPARRDHAMAYDEVRRRVVLFGGWTGVGQFHNDTWEHDGTNWQSVTTVVAPPARANAAMAYDSRRNRMVLVGGVVNSIGFTDVWEFDGAWTLTATAPPVLWRHAMAFDPVRGRIVTCGGILHPSGDGASTWDFDGTTWTQHDPPAFPRLWGNASMVFDLEAGRLVLWGGEIPVLPGPYPIYEHASWVFEPAPVATATRHGVGCAGSAGIPTLDRTSPGSPGLGSAVTLQIGGLPGGNGFAWLGASLDLRQWNGQPLPIALDANGLPGCMLWTGADAVLLLSSTNGTAALTFTIPANPAIAGAHIGLQALSLDLNAPNGIGALSNALIMRTW